jgi:hypothetical protein
VAVTKFGSSNLFGKQKFNRLGQAADSVAARAALIVDYLVVAGGAGGGVSWWLVVLVVRSL